LLDLAEWSKDAEQVIESLPTSTDEAIATSRRKLTGIKRPARFYDRSSASHFANELDSLLDLLRKPGLDPEETLKVLVSFFEADSKLKEMADDSNSDMGYLFKQSAPNLLVEVAQKVTDQNLLSKAIKKLYTSNNYGVRDTIVDRAGEFLTPESLESLYDFYRSKHGAILQMKLSGMDSSRKPPPPSFLRNLSTRVRSDFFKRPISRTRSEDRLLGEASESHFIFASAPPKPRAQEFLLETRGRRHAIGSQELARRSGKKADA